MIIVWTSVKQRVHSKAVHTGDLLQDQFSSALKLVIPQKHFLKVAEGRHIVDTDYITERLRNKLIYHVAEN